MLTQGLVLYGIRSVYYNSPCYGIVITARCDLAQSKVDTVHYLTAVSLNDWILTDCLKMVTNEIVKESQRALTKWMEEKSLNPKLIKTLGPQNLRVILEEYESDRNRKRQILRFIEKWELCVNIFCKKIKLSKVIKLLNEDESFRTKKDNKINLILKNQLTGYYFIPGPEININDHLGLVINMRDINQLDVETINKLLNGEIDCRILSNFDRAALSNYFYLESKDDYAYWVTVIPSPRIEHILQYFTQMFSRIGLEDLSDEFLEKVKNYQVI